MSVVEFVFTEAVINMFRIIFEFETLMDGCFQKIRAVEQRLWTEILEIVEK